MKKKTQINGTLAVTIKFFYGLTLSDPLSPNVSAKHLLRHTIMFVLAF